MWHYQSIGQQRGMFAFAEFLQSDTYRRWADEQTDEPPALIDAIQGWLEEGDGLDNCPTYESLLLTIIAIIDEWILGDQRLVVDSLLCPGNPEERTALFKGKDLTELWPRGPEVLYHPVMQPVYFEMLQGQHRTSS